MSAVVPFGSPAEVLAAEMRRVDFLVRARVVAWRAWIADGRAPKYWGMVLVDDAEVDRYLSSPFAWPPPLPAEHAALAAEFMSAHAEATIEIHQRLAVTPKETDRVRFLADRFGLPSTDVDILLLAALPEFDLRYRRIYAYIMDDASRTRPSVGLLAEMVAHLTPDPLELRRRFAGPLVDEGMLIVGGGPDGAEGLGERPVRIDDRTYSFLTGDDSVDGRLGDFVSVTDVSDPAAEGECPEHLHPTARWMAQTTIQGRPSFGYLYGPDTHAKVRAAQGIVREAARAGAEQVRRLIVVDTPAMLRSGRAWEATTGLVRRESIYQRAAVLWEGCDALFESPADRWRWEKLIASLDRLEAPTFIDRTPLWEPLGLPDGLEYVRLSFETPSTTEREQLWRSLVDGALASDGKLAGDLAHRFRLSDGQIRDAAKIASGLARSRDPGSPGLCREDFFEAARRVSAARTVSFSIRIPPDAKRSLDDLVLPPQTRWQLDELEARIRNTVQVSELVNGAGARLGTVALFAGSPGTGKTMAAEIVASRLQVDLYKVDLSQVVSKWVGETEERLERVFADAEGTDAVVFFDEADAMFGKRGEVKEAHDRWANMEVSFLLQRIERYPGLVILATNLAQNIDDAFRRRVHVVVDFLFPDKTLRRELYDGMLASESVLAPSPDCLGEIAYAFEFSGGMIRNVVIDAAHRAFRRQNDDASGQSADWGGPDERARITEDDLVFAVCRQLQRTGRPLTAADFPGSLDELRRRVCATSGVVERS